MHARSFVGVALVLQSQRRGRLPMPHTGSLGRLLGALLLAAHAWWHGTFTGGYWQPTADFTVPIQNYAMKWFLPLLLCHLLKATSKGNKTPRFYVAPQLSSTFDLLDEVLKSKGFKQRVADVPVYNISSMLASESEIGRAHV